MRTEVEELAGSRVRIDVEVPAADVEKSIERAASELSKDMKIPGFRKGKVPPKLVLQRVGRAALMEEALRGALPEWYERALIGSGVASVGDPKLDVSELPGEGEPLSFAIEVAVRPTARLGDYRSLEVGRAEPEVPAEAVEAELERLRDGLASLRPVERQARGGDFLLVDYRGEVDGAQIEGGEARDFLLELGADELLDGFDEGLDGAAAGEQRDVEVSFPDGYQPERLAGKDAVFRVDVKEVREKQLPDLDDDFAAEASEFDTLDELREDIAAKLGEAFERRSDEQFREAAVDAAVEASDVNVPDEVIRARATEIWERVERSLEARGIGAESFLQMQGKTREEMIDEAREDAERGLKREAVLAAIAEAEGVDVSEEELLDALRPPEDAEEGNGSGAAKPEQVLDRLRETGRDALLREDLRLRKAADVLVDSAKPIPLERAEARERLWTPEKERDEKGALWTPGDD